MLSQSCLYIASKVNVLVGREGWYKRIDREKSDVKRQTQLSDQHCVDPTGGAIDRIFNGAKREVIQKHTPTVKAPMSMMPAAAGKPAEPESLIQFSIFILVSCSIISFQIVRLKTNGNEI